MSIQINKNYYEYSFQLQQFKKSIFLMKETCIIHITKLKKTLQTNPIVSK